MPLYITNGSFVKTVQLASTANGLGASMQGVEDSAGHFVGTNTETVLAEIGAVTGRQPTVEEVEKNYLQSKLTLTNPEWFYDSGITAAKVQTPQVVAGTLSNILGYKRHQTGADAGGIVNLLWGNTTEPTLRIKGGTSGSWGITTRFKLGTTPDTQTRAGLRMRDTANGNFLEVGAFGEAEFTLLANAGDVPSIINEDAPQAQYDTDPHRFRIWRVGTTTTLEIDGAIIGTTDAFPGDDVGISFTCQNGTTAANQILDWSDVGILVEQT